MKRSLPLTPYTAIIMALIIMSFSGCVLISFNDYGAVTAKGEPEIYEFKTGAYNGIKIEGFCEIRYYSAPSDTVTLSVSPNVREYYTVEVTNGELAVHTSKRINFRSGNSPVLTVSTPVLNRLTIEGAGTVTTFDTITAESLTFILNGAGTGKAELNVGSLYAELSGAGDLILSGKADTAGLSLSGTGELDALSLQTRQAEVSLSGAGAISLSCSENLRINANGLGEVKYRGSPSLNLNKDGIVSIRQVN